MLILNYKSLHELIDEFYQKNHNFGFTSNFSSLVINEKFNYQKTQLYIFNKIVKILFHFSETKFPVIFLKNAHKLFTYTPGALCVPHINKAA